MSIFEMEKMKMKEEGRFEGRIEGKVEGLELSLKVIALMKKGKSVEEISNSLDIPLQKIEAIKQVLKSF